MELASEEAVPISTEICIESESKVEQRTKDRCKTDGDNDDSPIPTQIVFEKEEMPSKVVKHDDSPVPGNSDEIYNKIKSAGITLEQFRALAEVGLTIIEG